MRFAGEWSLRLLWQQELLKVLSSWWWRMGPTERSHQCWHEAAKDGGREDTDYIGRSQWWVAYIWGINDTWGKHLVHGFVDEKTHEWDDEVAEGILLKVERRSVTWSRLLIFQGVPWQRELQPCWRGLWERFWWSHIVCQSCLVAYTSSCIDQFVATQADLLTRALIATQCLTWIIGCREIAIQKDERQNVRSSFVFNKDLLMW